MKKYMDEIEKMFPGEAYYFGIEKQSLSPTIQIRIRDYYMEIPTGIYKITQEEMDREFGYALEAIKGKLDDIKANRKLP